MVSKLNYFIKKYLCYSSSKIKIRFNHCWNIATQLWIESKTLHCLYCSSMEEVVGFRAFSAAVMDMDHWIFLSNFG
jgi:hypothetical protein